MKRLPVLAGPSGFSGQDPATGLDGEGDVQLLLAVSGRCGIWTPSSTSSTSSVEGSVPERRTLPLRYTPLFETDEFRFIPLRRRASPETATILSFTKAEGWGGIDKFGRLRVFARRSFSLSAHRLRFCTGLNEVPFKGYQVVRKNLTCSIRLESSVASAASSDSYGPSWSSLDRIGDTDKASGPFARCLFLTRNVARFWGVASWRVIVRSPRSSPSPVSLSFISTYFKSRSAPAASEKEVSAGE